MLVASLQIIFGFAVLMWAADRFVTGASGLARNLGVNPLIIGLTIVALGTSAPEIFVAIMAALDGHTGIAIGNAIGSNIANVGLVLGITALITPLSVRSKTLKREFPIMFLILLLIAVLLLDGELNRIDGAILLISLVLLMAWMIFTGLKKQPDEPLSDEFEAEIPSTLSNKVAIIWFVIGLVLLPISSEYLVQGAITVAKYFGVSDLIIGLTIVAIGTSLPEVAASIMSALKGEADIAVGNIIGSNMFNIVAVLAVPGLLHPAAVPSMLLYRDIPVMIGISILFFLVAYGFRGPGVVQRWEGALLLCVYIGYLVLLLYTQ